MAVTEPTFTLGVEEEYLLVDLTTRDLAIDPPETLIEEIANQFEGQVSPEFLRSQVEVGTRVCNTVAEARDSLAHLRRTVADAAGRHGLAPIASATHPFGSWSGQLHTDRQRYNELAEDMQVVARRLLTCGMHVHIGVEDPDLRIEIFNQIPYFLPHLLALSTSSPFWQGVETGLKSYRISAFDELPRTGLPEAFNGYADYQNTVDVLVNAGIIEDATKLWWDVRPSGRFPTIEMRITDMPTYLEDTVTIAAIFRCLCRMLYRLSRANMRWRDYSRFLIAQNRWRAQRYGFDEGMVDFGKGKIVPYADLLEEMIELLREDAEYFGCVKEIEAARDILSRGTGAHRQIDCFHKALADGATQEEALKTVVDLIIAETVRGLYGDADG